MHNLNRFILFLVAASAFAATPVASIKSSSDFQLSGVSVATAGVPSWPIMAGDSVVAGTTAATIRFMDGTMVTLAPYSRVAVQEKKGRSKPPARERIHVVHAGAIVRGQLLLWQHPVAGTTRRRHNRVGWGLSDQ